MIRDVAAIWSSMQEQALSEMFIVSFFTDSWRSSSMKLSAETSPFRDNNNMPQNVLFFNLSNTYPNGTASNTATWIIHGLWSFNMTSAESAFLTLYDHHLYSLTEPDG